MELFFSDQEVADARAKWLTDVHEYIKATNAALNGIRRLPIYDFGVARACEWLKDATNGRFYRRPGHTLIIAGDEHLQAAAEQSDLPDDTLFVHRSAWRRWRTGFYLDETVWWQEISWAINCPQWIIDLSTPFDRELRLVPNKTFLCSEYVAGRGTHTLLSLDDSGQVSEERYSEWLDS